MDKKLEYVKQRLKNSFDVKYREINTKIGKCTLVFIDDLCGVSFISEYIITPLKKQQYTYTNVEEVVYNVLDINIANYAKDLDDAILHVLSGDVILLFEDFEKIIYCEVKGFVRRGISIPVTESVIKGPREGFNELIVDNVSLIRRKVKNSDLKFEPIFKGRDSQTVVAISYIQGIAPEALINHVREKVKNMDIKFILDTNYIEDELRVQKSAFDTIGYTEKPDEVAAKILEGRVSVLVDGTPFVITVPYFFLENFQAPDDYYINKYYANFTRILRWLAFFLAVFSPGIYIAIINYHYSMLPSSFLFRLAVARAGVPLPTIVEIIIMMLAFQLIKEAGLRLPQPIGGAMSIVAALILGDAVVGAGISSRITIIIVAVSTLSYFLIPKLYGSMSIWSIIITLLSAIFGLPGFFIGSIILLARLSDLETTGYAYLFPMGSLKTYNFHDILFRGDLKKISQDIVVDGGEDSNEETS
ncbi:spore germination protein [Clostridium sp. HCP1S3_B4]|uniref:spore germination protein n=1 Tax=unclassified Clostridium TaxID=2614128 RepID=UPI002A79700C|nr:spore germination protein [Clostridium sp.]